MKRIFLTMMLFLVISLLAGCAGFQEFDGNGKLVSEVRAGGLLRTITVKRLYYQGENGVRGTLKEHTVSTDSTSKDVLLGFDKLLNSTINTIGKSPL